MRRAHRTAAFAHLLAWMAIGLVAVPLPGMAACQCSAAGVECPASVARSTPSTCPHCQKSQGPSHGQYPDKHQCGSRCPCLDRGNPPRPEAPATLGSTSQQVMPALATGTARPIYHAPAQRPTQGDLGTASGTAMGPLARCAQLSRFTL